MSTVSNSSDFNIWLQTFIKSKKSFNVIISKNSQQIIYESDSGELKKKHFSDSRMNPKVFSIANAIKKETYPFILANKQYSKPEERASIRYYNFQNIPKKLDHFYYVDIKSAYISALYFNKIISLELFNKINELPKKDRLIALGMMAYEPYLIQYSEGIKINTTRIRNEYSPVFYSACAYIEVLMEDLIKLIGRTKYIYYWVDGFFFKSLKDYYLISDYLKNKGYNFSFDECRNLISIDNGSHYNINFDQYCKNNKGIYGLHPKLYNIPDYFQVNKDNKENFELLQKEDYSGLLSKFITQKYGEII